MSSADTLAKAETNCLHADRLNRVRELRFSEPMTLANGCLGGVDGARPLRWSISQAGRGLSAASLSKSAVRRGPLDSSISSVTWTTLFCCECSRRNSLKLENRAASRIEDLADQYLAAKAEQW